MKLISWNVNGLRACIQKGFLEQFDQLDADFFCLQETKLSAGQLELDLPGYYQYWNYAEKKGYSGTAIFAKREPISVTYGIGVPELDTEGRVITLEYPEFYLVTCYTPNAQRGLARLDHRMTWDDAFRDYLKKLDSVRPVIICGDLNVAHQEIDLKNPKSNRGNAGFSDEERESFQKTLDMGFTDTFRHLHPDAAGRYSWWSYMYHARENNAGWRIDYFLVSDRLKESVYRADIHDKIMGSDHCPVELQIDTPVNGGIWSSERRGMSSVVSAEEKPKKENAKAGAVNAKAFAAFFLVCAVLFGVALFPKFRSESQPTEPSEEPGAPIEVQVINDSLQKVVKYTDIFDSSGNYDPYYSDRLTHGEDTYYFYYFDDTTLTDANVWLRIDLTDAGLECYSKDWTIQLEPLTLDSSETGNTDRLLDFENISMVKYYTDTPYAEDPDSLLAGWVIWGHLPQGAQFRVNLLDGQQAVYSADVNLRPFIDPASIIRIENALDITPYYTPLASYFKESDPQSNKRDSVIFDGSEEYYVDELVPGEPVISNSDYWFRVDLTEEAMAALAGVEYEFDFVSAANSIWSTNRVRIDRYYTDRTCSQLAGWFVYGITDESGTGYFTLTWDNGAGGDFQMYTMDLVPYVNTEEASEMLTNKLVEYIIVHPCICETLRTQTDGVLSSTQSDSALRILVRSYPVLEELTHREDAVQCVMDWSTSPDEPSYRIPDALLEYVLYPYMTEVQEVMFLTCSYSSCSREFSFDLSISIDNDPGQLSTLQIVLLVHEFGDDLYQYFSKCSSQSVRLGLYVALRGSSSLLLELEDRPDARQALEWCSTEPFADGPLPYLLEMWDEIEGIKGYLYGSEE